jgi:hypothetical protein
MFRSLCLSGRLLILFPTSQLVQGRVYSGMSFPLCFCAMKVILPTSSAIIEDIRNNREPGSALVAYYYFDYKDTSKRDIRGVMASLIFQLGSDSVRCWGVLHQLYTQCRHGSDQPSIVALANCLENMLKLPGQLPIFIILDALDECPNDTETPSDREKVLNFLEDLVGSQHANLFICVTSRPEQDIQSVFNTLTSHHAGSPFTTKSVKERLSICTFAPLFKQTERCGGGKRNTKNSLLIRFLNVPMACELSDTVHDYYF